MESISRKYNNINAIVDYKTELLGIIMWISNYHNKYKELFEIYENEFYINKIIKEFSRYKDDKVIKMFEELCEKHSFGYDGPLNLFLQLNSDLNSTKINDYVYSECLNKDDNVYKFINDLYDFSERIGFKDYYNSNKKEYTKYVDSIIKIFEKDNLEDYINNYYGIKLNKEIYINCIPFTTNGSFNVTLDNTIYNCTPVYKHRKKENLYDVSKEEIHFKMVTLHELSHGIVDPITDKLQLVTAKTNLFDDIKEQMKKQAYPTDKEIINEHIIRGIEARFILNKYNDLDMYNYYINSDISNAFKYLPQVLESLEFYEQNRDIYPNFEIFYPNIISNIKKSKNKIENKL